MNKIFDLVLILLLFTASMFADNSFGLKNVDQDNSPLQKKYGNSPFVVSLGTNLSFFSGEKGKWQLGYSFGLTLSIPVYRNLSIMLPFSYTGIKTAPRNVEDRTYPGTGNVYKNLRDWQVSVVFIEFPILFLSYGFLNQKNYGLRYFIGLEAAFARKDASEVIKYTETDEIIVGANPDSVDPPNYKLRSGGNIGSGLRFHLRHFYMDLLYSYYPGKFKDIAPLNSISLKFGIGVPNE